MFVLFLTDTLILKCKMFVTLNHLVNRPLLNANYTKRVKRPILEVKIKLVTKPLPPMGKERYEDRK